MAGSAEADAGDGEDVVLLQFPHEGDVVGDGRPWKDVEGAHGLNDGKARLDEDVVQGVTFLLIVEDIDAVLWNLLTRRCMRAGALMKPSILLEKIMASMRGFKFVMRGEAVM
jgi:hypothetical protein